MNTVYDSVFALTRAAIWGDELTLSEQTDWDELYKVMRRNKLVPLTYNYISKIATRYSIPEDILAAWKKESASRAINQMFVFSEIRKIISEAENRNLRLVMFKGIGVATLYPDPNMRFSSDSDILVREEEQVATVKMLEDMGYVSIAEGAKEHVPVFIKRAGKVVSKIELHDCLWEDYEGKQAEILDSLKLDSPSTLIKEKFMGIEYYSLGINEHLIYQIFHIVKHLFFEGISLRYLVDISLFINKHEKQIDWKRIREAMKCLHYERFFDCIVAICRENLKLDVNVEGAESVTVVMKEHLINDILRDRSAESSTDSFETINFLETYFMRTIAIKESKFNQKRKQILPFPSELHERYAYARKYPILLPMAWVHRVFFFATYAIKGRKKGKNGTEAMKKSEYRLNLMKELGLMDTDTELKKSKKGE